MPSRERAKGPERVLGLLGPLVVSPEWRKGSFSWDKQEKAVTGSPAAHGWAPDCLELC